MLFHRASALAVVSHRPVKNGAEIIIIQRKIGWQHVGLLLRCGASIKAQIDRDMDPGNNLIIEHPFNVTARNGIEQEFLHRFIGLALDRREKAHLIKAC